MGSRVIFKRAIYKFQTTSSIRGKKQLSHLEIFTFSFIIILIPKNFLIGGGVV